MILLATCINDLEAIGQKAMSVADDKDLWLEREKEETRLTRRSLKLDVAAKIALRQFGTSARK